MNDKKLRSSAQWLRESGKVCVLPYKGAHSLPGWTHGHHVTSGSWILACTDIICSFNYLLFATLSLLEKSTFTFNNVPMREILLLF